MFSHGRSLSEEPCSAQWGFKGSFEVCRGRVRLQLCPVKLQSCGEDRAGLPRAGVAANSSLGKGRERMLYRPGSERDPSCLFRLAAPSELVA